MNLFLQRCITGLIFAASLIACFCIPLLFTLLLLAAGLYIIFFEMKFFRNKKLILFVYIFLGLYCLLFLNQFPYYRNLIMYLLAYVFIFDSSAYLTGSLLGKHHLAPHISPKKTWEGLFGAGIITTIFVFMTVRHGTLYDHYFASFLICSSAFLGDLFMSWLKRENGLKNAGTLLPGHGGLLDRFDSIFLTAIVFYVFRFFFAALFL